MSLSKRKRAQGSIEFVSIAAVMLLIFMGMFVVIQGRISGAYKGRIYNSMEDTARMLNTEIRLANSIDGTYYRSFYLPYTIEGHNYTISLDNSNEISLSAEGVDFVIFLDDNVSGYIKKGKNDIMKVGDNVTINTICSGGAGTDDPNCGIIDCSGWYEFNGDQGAYAADVQLCYGRESITTNRCEEVEDCLDSNSVDCASQPLLAIATYTCGECKFIAGTNCTNAFRGGCAPYAFGTDCGAGNICDGNGHCEAPVCIEDGYCDHDAGENSVNCLVDCPPAVPQIAIMHEGVRVATFNDDGSITLLGTCSSGGTCNNPPAGSFVITGMGGGVVAYIDTNGNLCVKDSNCNDNDDNCNNPGPDSFVVKATTTIVSYISNTGNLCLTGELIESGTP